MSVTPQASNRAMPAFRLERTLLGVSAWIRGQLWLKPMLRLVPPGWRAWASKNAMKATRSGLRFERTPAWRKHDENAKVRPSLIVTTSSAGPGVNIFGYMRGEFGLAESARLYSRALIEGGFRVALNDINLGLAHGWNDVSLEPWIVGTAPYPNTIVFVNPDFLASALENIGQERLSGHRLIACWFWELENVPEAWLPAIGMVDEILVASSFVESAFRRATDKPILRIPPPLHAMEDSGLQREDFGLAANKFVFLCTFDFHSSIERKNPFAAISAFQLAFPAEREDVCLLVKSTGGQWAPQELRRLLGAASADPRVLIRDDLIDKAHVRSLQRCCDAYVSLHRAEGFGLGMAECMALGKPVIATRWSGNMDFMDDRNSILVDCRLIPIRAGDYPHHENSRWAEPDIEAAAAAMTRLVDEPGLAEKIGRSAQAVREKLAPESAARSLADWLDRPHSNSERSTL